MSLLLSAILPYAVPPPPPPPFPFSKPCSAILKLNPIAIHLKPSLSFSRCSSKNGCGASWKQSIYVYPDPDPEFAKAETEKFGDELRKKLVKSKETFGDDMDAVVKVCAQIFSDFLHKEYGGPGTLVVEPFTDMLLALKEKKLPGAPEAARAAILWAQTYVDEDWEIWTCEGSQKL